MARRTIKFRSRPNVVQGSNKLIDGDGDAEAWPLQKFQWVSTKWLVSMRPLLSLLALLHISCALLLFLVSTGTTGGP